MQYLNTPTEQSDRASPAHGIPNREDKGEDKGHLALTLLGGQGEVCVCVSIRLCISFCECEWASLQCISVCVCVWGGGGGYVSVVV